MTEPRVPFSVSKVEMHEAMGAAMAEWAWVEDALVKQLRAVLGCELKQAGIIWYTVVSFKGKLEMVDALMHQAEKAQSLMKRWPSCQAYLRDLNGKRNQIAHWELVGSIDEGDPKLPPMQFATPRLQPHAFDATPRMEKFQAGIGVEDVLFYKRSFGYVSREVKELSLHMLGLVPWSEKFAQPIVRLQMSDSVSPRTP